MKNVDVKTLKNWLDNEEAVLIDVREIAEHENQRIAGATLIPLAEITKEKLPDIKNKKLVIHCQGGKRSLNACQKLMAENIGCEIYNLEGGINSWCVQGCDVISTKKFFLPVDRQVQLTIGSLVFISSMLGYFFNINFLFISGFFGAGLIFAGLTGNCTLAKIIAKMPWNKS
jgi:rhodanese-related sulfurtransferase